MSVASGVTSPQADISASLACPATVHVRTVASCTLTVANAGPATARLVRAGISLPFRLWPLSAPGSLWFGDSGLWLVHTLAPGASVAFTVSFRALVPGRDSVLAVALSENPDPNFANNLARATVTITS